MALSSGSQYDHSHRGNAHSITQRACTFKTYSAGESFTDLGCGDIHNVRDETGAEAKDVAVQIVPHGAPEANQRRTTQDCANVLPCP